jgi:hypothetical protein
MMLVSFNSSFDCTGNQKKIYFTCCFLPFLDFVDYGRNSHQEEGYEDKSGCSGCNYNRGDTSKICKEIVLNSNSSKVVRDSGMHMHEGVQWSACL